MPEQGHGTLAPGVRLAIRYAAVRAAAALIAAALGTVLILGLVSALRGFLSTVVLALFLSFAIEPAVNWLSINGWRPGGRRGWRRGAATGALFLVVFVIGIALFAIVVPAIVGGVQELLASLPGALDRASEVTERWLDIQLSTQTIQNALRDAASDVGSVAGNLAGSILGFGAAVLGAVFQWATILFFTFYIVADGPRLRRAICSRLPPRRQRDVLWTWETAIDMTGGYFYSRLLLAVISGVAIYIVMRVVGIPFAAALAVFTGVVSQFIPTIGTYIAGALPILTALLFNNLGDAIVILVYMAVYQQVENIFLSPKLTARTMALHPAVAFGAALIGGALGGIPAAFLALPVAGVIQAAVSAYAHRYDVVESELTEGRASAEPEPGTGGAAADDAAPTAPVREDRAGPASS